MEKMRIAEALFPRGSANGNVKAGLLHDDRIILPFNGSVTPSYRITRELLLEVANDSDAEFERAVSIVISQQKTPDARSLVSRANSVQQFLQCANEYLAEEVKDYNKDLGFDFDMFLCKVYPRQIPIFIVEFFPRTSQEPVNDFGSLVYLHSEADIRTLFTISELLSQLVWDRSVVQDDNHLKLTSKESVKLFIQAGCLITLTNCLYQKCQDIKSEIAKNN